MESHMIDKSNRYGVSLGNRSVGSCERFKLSRGNDGSSEAKLKREQG